MRDLAKGVTYQAFQAEDVDGVIEVIKEYYKDDYFHNACYDRQYLLTAARDGRRQIFVAKNGAGQVIGIVNGNYRGYFPGSYELGMHVFRESYQGLSLAKGLLKYCIENMCQMNIYGVYGMPVTYHSRSQYECERVNLVATGFWLGRYRADRGFFSSKPNSPKLHSLVVAKKGNKPQTAEFFVPCEHQGFVKEYYGLLDTPIRFGEDGQLQAAVSSIYFKDTKDAYNREIYVRSVGRDIIERLKALESDGCDKTSYMLFINMLDCGFSDCYYRLCKLGYYFCGVHPLHEGCEYMLMHKEAAAGYDWNELILTPTNQKLLNYILNNR